MGDLGHDEYFQQGKRAVSNSIASGDYLGSISLLDELQLADAGLDFGAVNAGVAGRHTIGFSFDRSLLPDGDFIAHVFAECINDGLAMMGNLEAIRSELENIQPTTPALQCFVDTLREWVDSFQVNRVKAYLSEWMPQDTNVDL